MFKLLLRWFKREPNPYIGFFRGWNADRYCVWNDDHCLWTINGYQFFADYSGSRSRNIPLLSNLPEEHKRLLWRALKHDAAVDAIQRLENAMVTTVERD